MGHLTIGVLIASFVFFRFKIFHFDMFRLRNTFSELGFVQGATTIDWGVFKALDSSIDDLFDYIHYFHI